MSKLRSYTFHRLLSQPGEEGFPFYHKAQVVDRDNVFVPSGWDSWGLIKVQGNSFDCEAWSADDSVYDNDNNNNSSTLLARGRAIFESEVKKPQKNKVSFLFFSFFFFLTCSSKSIISQPTIKAEDEQAFLERNLELLASMSGGMGSGTASPLGVGITEGLSSATRLTSTSTMSSNEMLEDVSQKLARLAKLKVIVICKYISLLCCHC